jgi:D-galactarolactone cycloisomerase
MKIEHFQTHHIRLPFQSGGPFGWGRVEWRAFDLVLLRVEVEGGLVGWGEAWGFTDAGAARDALEHVVGPSIVGLDARDIEGISHVLQSKHGAPGLSSPAMNAISAVDIALWDIAGKAAGVPLYRLFGGARRMTIPFYASFFRYENPEIVAERAGAAKAEGFHHIKLHETCEAEIRAARNAVGPETKLMFDISAAWEPHAAREKIEQIRAYDPLWFEEPLSPQDDFDALAQLRADTGIAIAAGENAAGAMEFKKMMKAGAVDYVQPNPTKAGGITVFREVVALANDLDVVVIPHSPIFGPGLLASLHLSAGLGDDSIAEWLYYKEIDADVYGYAVVPEQGTIEVPQGPGLGLDPDTDVLRDFSVEAP